MSDWEQFLDEVSWFLRPGESAEVGEARPWARGSIDGLPELSALLASGHGHARVRRRYRLELLVWGSSGHRRGWLCHPPRDPEGDRVAQTHKSFWKACGGIAERFSEPTTWWTNQNEVLTIGATQVRIGDVLNDYAWLWENDGWRSLSTQTITMPSR